jgi:RNA polymerase sigma factor (sigma-70 family)
MKETLALERLQSEQDRRISETVEREQTRLRNFIRRRVADQRDAEDILQEVFYEFVEAYRMMKPIEQVSGWLFRVARNRIIDLFRRRKPGSLSDPATVGDDGEELLLQDLVPSRELGPDAAYARSVLLSELDEALDELPDQQRGAFIAHEVEGRSFKDLSAETGVSVNTLIARKHRAVVHLRQRLQAIHDEFSNG